MAGTKEYDYIIVGAGSAGCVLAYRLGANPDNRILVLEAGGPDTDPLIHIPLGLGKMHDKRAHDWGYDAEPEQRMNGREIEAMRGKVVGGSSSINVMAYVRGHRGDYDRWADNGATGWAYADVLPYFRRMESWEGGEDTWRGGDGPLHTQSAKSQDPLWEAWLEAGMTAGIGYTEDYNGEKQEGLGRSQSNIHEGRRHSAATAFLRPAMRRGNVDLRVSTPVSRVVMDGKRAVGVEFIRLGRPQIIRAAKEVVLSGGVFNSPQLLMLSGIGPAAHLHEHGIEPVIDLPGVGEHLADHVDVSMQYGSDFAELSHARHQRLDRAAMLMGRWLVNGSGPGGGSLFSVVLFNAAGDVNPEKLKEDLKELPYLADYAARAVDCFDDDGELRKAPGKAAKPSGGLPPVADSIAILRARGEDCAANNFARVGYLYKTTYAYDEYFFNSAFELGRFVVRKNWDAVAAALGPASQ